MIPIFHSFHVVFLSFSEDQIVFYFINAVTLREKISKIQASSQRLNVKKFENVSFDQNQTLCLENKYARIATQWILTAELLEEKTLEEVKIQTNTVRSKVIQSKKAIKLH